MALATAVRFYFVSWLGERTVADIRLAVHRNLLRLSPGFFEENRPAEITSRITVDTTIIEQVVGTTVSVALRNIVMGTACVIILFALSPKLAAHAAARRAAGGRPDHDRRAQGARDLDPEPGPHRRCRRGHQRSPRRDEDRPGVQPAGPRDRPLRATSVETRLRHRQAAHPAARGDDRDRHLPAVRRDHHDHLAGRGRRQPRAG